MLTGLSLASCANSGSTTAVCRTPETTTSAAVTAPVLGVVLQSSRAINVRFSALDLPVSATNAAFYTLSSTTDAAFSTPVSASKVGYDRQTTSFTTAVIPKTINETRLHLLFPFSMHQGQRYTLKLNGAIVNGIPLAAPASSIHFSFNNCRISPSIQVSQAGYLPSSPKFAYVGNWLGTAGAMPVDNTVYQVIDASSGAIKLSGNATLRAAADPWSGNDVYEVDLSALKVAGSYRLLIDGMGVSQPFKVDVNMAENIYRKVMRVLYHVRNGTVISAPYAEPGYERPQGGIAANLDGVFHAALTSVAYPFNNGEVANQYHPVSKGWFDAGDYGQYIPNAAIAFWAVGVAMDLAPTGFADGELNIPESTNGIPDVIDEIGWEMDWALSMQDTIDGGVYFRIASETWNVSLPHLVALPRFIYEKTTHATANFAAMAAIYARLIKPYDAARSATALAAAEHAWVFLQTHVQWPAAGITYTNPAKTHSGTYSDKSAQDNLLWASAELLRTTGLQKYRTYYQTHVATVVADATNIPQFNKVAMAAHWAYAMLAPPSDPYAAQARASIISSSDWRVRQANTHPYRAAMHHYIGWAGWGSFGQSSRAVLPLLQGYALNGNKNYLQTAYATLYPELGANPQSMSYITGIGVISPQDPLFMLSQFDLLAAPLPGIPVNGPHFYLPGSIAAHRLLNAVYLPPNLPTIANDFSTAYPVLRRYTDSHLLPPMSEPTIAEDVEVAMGFALIGRASLNLIRFY